MYHGPNWKPATAEELRGRVAEELSLTDDWVLDGNYDSKLGRMLVDRAELIIWLDLPLYLKLWRLAGRTTKRFVRLGGQR